MGNLYKIWRGGINYVAHRDIKRVFIDNVDGIKQGAAFRFIQGLDAGINRTAWTPEGNLYAGGVGSGGN